MVQSSLRVLGVLTVFLCGVFLTLQVPSIKRDLLVWIIEKTLDEPDHKVVIDTVDGILPFTATVPNLEIYDNQDLWLSLKQIDIKISWLPFKIDFIRLAKIKVLKRPVFQSVSIDVVSLIPALIKQRALQEFCVQAITLDPPLLGKAYDARLSWQLHPIQGQNIDLQTSVGNLSATLLQTQDEEINVENIQLLYQDFAFKGAAKILYPSDKPVQVDVSLAGEKLSVSLVVKKDHNFVTVEDIVLAFSEKTLTGNLQINTETHDLKGIFKGHVFPNVQPLTATLEGTLTHPHLKVTSSDHQTAADVQWNQDTDTLSFDFLLKKLEIPHMTPGDLKKLEAPDLMLEGLAGKGTITSALTGQASVHLTAGKVNALAFGKSALTLKLDKGQGAYQLDLAPVVQGIKVSLDSKGKVSLEKGNPKIKGDVTVKTFIARSKKRTGQLAKKDISIKIAFEWSLQELVWRAVYRPDTTEPLYLKGRLGLEEGKVSPNSPCSITAKGQFDLSTLTPWISNGDRISGKAFFDLALTGNYASPSLQGTLKVKKGFYEIAEFGTCIGDVNLELQATGSTLTIKNLQATDGTKRPSPQGQITGQGVIQVKDLFCPLLDISLKVQDFQVAASDSFFARVEGAVTLKGPCQEAKVEGVVTLDPAKLMLEEVNPTPSIPVIKLNDPGQKYKPKGYKKAKRKIFPISLKLKAPKRFMIQGFGLESLWEGEIDVVSYLSDTQMLGSITLVKGKLDLLGKVMKISHGRISYDNLEPNDPLLSIIAVREVEGVELNLIVEGRASSPRFTFLSSPALPEEEILSRLLFGKELNKISMGQSLQLAAALASMNGQKGLNIMDKVRSSFGLDILEIKENKNNADGSTSQALSIGKEFGKVRVSLDQAVSGSSSGSSKATISTALTPSLNLDVDIGGVQGSNVGFSWVKRY